MVDARDGSEGWDVHLSIPPQDGSDLLDAARGIAVQGAALVDSADSELNELVLFSRENDADRARDGANGVRSLERVCGRSAGLTIGRLIPPCASSDR